MISRFKKDDDDDDRGVALTEKLIKIQQHNNQGFKRDFLRAQLVGERNKTPLAILILPLVGTSLTYSCE